MKQCSVYLPEDLLAAYKSLNTHVPLSTRVKILLEDFVMENHITVSTGVKPIPDSVFTFIEDKVDAKIANDALSSNEPIHDWDSIKKELGLTDGPPNTSDGATT